MKIDYQFILERHFTSLDIWDSIVSDVEAESLSYQQKFEIDRRLSQYERNPESAIPWEQVEDEAIARLRK